MAASTEITVLKIDILWMLEKFAFILIFFPKFGHKISIKMNKISVSILLKIVENWKF